MSTRFSTPKFGATTRSIVKALFDDMGIAPRIEQHQVWMIWDKVVGAQIAAHARPASIRNNVLEVRVDHAVWMQQLQLLKPQILAKINRELNCIPIDSMYLRRKTPEPLVRKEPQTELILPELSIMEMLRAERLVEPIRDENVRSAMLRLLSKQMRLDKLRQIEGALQQQS
ncbi:MAG: DUF721 domain-containing protein [Desulfuromonadaceae bacterium]|nr:DUF721 domain-containing protein [Desulfuromonadaceae bacterium]